jgi:hypothetical protein
MELYLIMEEALGASILATHLESGTRYSGATDFSGILEYLT